MTDSVICKACGKPIEGRYLTALGALWHPEHFRCAVCGRPIDEPQFTPLDGKPCHVECYRLRAAPRCAYCGKPLVGSYLVDGWGTKFCSVHRGQYPVCRYCGRLVPPRHQGSQAGRNGDVSCLVCRASAIDYMPQAKPLFARLVRWVNGQGLMYNQLALHVELLDRAGLARLMDRPYDGQCLGATLRTEYIEDGRLVRTEVKGVAILSGLPSTLFQAVTIHELAHAWLAVHHVTELNRTLEEGFCEVLSHRYLTELNTVESRFHATNIERNPSPVYGEGFRRVCALAQAIGFARLLERLRAERRLPVLNGQAKL